MHAGTVYSISYGGDQSMFGAIVGNWVLWIIEP